MILVIIFWIIALCVNGSITYFTGIYNLWYWDLIMVALLPITYLLVVGIYIAIVAFISLFFYSDKEITKPKPISAFFIKQSFRVIMGLSFIRVKRTGMENVPNDTKFLIISNHKSNFDPFPISYYFKGNIANVSKPSNLKMPVYGNFIKRCGYISMPRDDDFAAVKSIVKAANFIKNQITSVVIFPEGTRNKTEDPILEFKSGSFKIATKAKCPIVAVSLANTDEIHKRWPFKPTTVYMDVVGVYKYEDYKDMNTQELSSMIQEKIKEKYLERTKA
ncbi:MAG: 1-acyl-sn-glycerol-3-phosphate acyltransferase [Acholeplasmatales bacterium]|nr:1-acyl-sn-glycerol-3-phosphate acyltransferase [Acholeplasmatales bacterium]